MKNRGITLISLVITIVILIILAGVAINLTLGENGIFSKAKYAKEQYEMEAVKEKLNLAILEIQTGEAIGDNNLTLDEILIKLQEKFPEIEIEKDGETLKGIFEEYNFKIDSDFKVTIEGYNSEAKIYTVTFSGDNVISDGLNEVRENETYIANLSLTSGYGVTNVVVKMGETILTQGTDYTYENGSISIAKVTANLKITVETEKILVTGISLDKTTAIVYVGETLNLTVTTVEPSNAFDKSVTWTSSNTSIATVSNGKVTPKASGTTTITAMAVDGSEISASCDVTVIEKIYLIKDGIEMVEFEKYNIQTHTQEEGYSAIETEITDERASYQLVDFLTLDEYKSIKVDVEVTNFIYSTTNDTAFELLICDNDKPHTGSWFKSTVIALSTMGLNARERNIYYINLEDVTGTYGIGLRKNVSPATQVSYKLYNLWLEK